MRKLCKKFSVSRNAFYKLKKTRQRRSNRDDFILLLARQERIVNPMAGCKKVLFAIRPKMAQEGVTIGQNKFYELMKANKMQIKRRRKFTCRTTKQDPSQIPSMNLVKGLKIDSPNQALCSDITYIYTDEGFLFLSLMMDMFVRDIVGWAVKDSLDTEGPLEALRMARMTLPVTARPKAHSDRGCQYGARIYRKELESYGWESSMTEVLHCYENAMAERLNGILKSEYFLDRHFKTKEEARKAIINAIHIYNTRRLHEKCDYKTPAEFRKECEKKAA